MRSRRFWLTLITNYAQLLPALLLYRMGAGIWFVLLLIQSGISQLNARAAGSGWSVVFLTLNHVISTAAAHKLSNLLYYTHVSSDYMTLAVGNLGMVGGMVLVVVMAIVIGIQQRAGRK